MTQRSGNPDQFLQLIGRTYYVRVRVPRTLEKYLRQSHIRKTLGTGDKAEANRRKHDVVARIKRELEALRKQPTKDENRGLSIADAKEWREEVKRAEALDDDGATHGVVLDLITEQALQIKKIHGAQKSARWFKMATTTAAPLTEHMETWLGQSDYRESTKAGHRRALADVTAFLQNPLATPADVSRAVVIDYLDNDLIKRGLAAATIRDRLVSMVGFWAWMESRALAPVGLNPWTGHKFSKKQNTGTRPPKRKGGFTDDELLALLEGNAQVKGWPTYSYFPDVMVLGMFTGARLESICALPVKAVTQGNGYAVIDIENDKTVAGNRPVGMTHPAVLEVLRRRTEGKAAADMLFEELRAGGLDDKFSSSVTKAFTRYRRACGVPDGTDFHSFRRRVCKVMEDHGTLVRDINRYVGQTVGALSADGYAGAAEARRSVELSRTIRFAAKVEDAALALALSHRPSPDALARRRRTT